ncbi:Rieske 2Fe-2S domain-containing protein, partial [Acinetobacter baumannii]
FDEPLHQRELKQLFQQGPRYVGHELMVPEAGDYSTLPWENEGRMLVRNAQGVELLSNVCRHRQAKMLDGRGHATNIVCPLHRWTYDLKGEL